MEEAGIAVMFLFATLLTSYFTSQLFSDVHFPLNYNQSVWSNHSSQWSYQTISDWYFINETESKVILSGVVGIFTYCEVPVKVPWSSNSAYCSHSCSGANCRHLALWPPSAGKADKVSCWRTQRPRQTDWGFEAASLPLHDKLLILEPQSHYCNRN